MTEPHQDKPGNPHRIRAVGGMGAIKERVIQYWKQKFNEQNINSHGEMFDKTLLGISWDTAVVSNFEEARKNPGDKEKWNAAIAKAAGVLGHIAYKDDVVGAIGILREVATLYLDSAKAPQDIRDYVMNDLLYANKSETELRALVGEPEKHRTLHATGKETGWKSFADMIRRRRRDVTPADGTPAKEGSIAL